MKNPYVTITADKLYIYITGITEKTDIAMNVKHSCKVGGNYPRFHELSQGICL